MAHTKSQNVDNFISSRSSTRLHCPPGGQSSMGSLIFGGGDDTAPVERVSRRAQRPMPQQSPESPFYNKADIPGLETQTKSNHKDVEQDKQQLSSNQYASGASQNNGNVLTDRRITRIHAPPGGASSFSLG